MKTFLKVWSILLLVVGGLEIIPLLTLSGNASEVGQAILVGIPIIVEAACVLAYLSREKKGI